MEPEDITQLIDQRIAAYFASQKAPVSNIKDQSSKSVVQKSLQILDGKNIQVGKTNGTMIGTEATQKIGLYGTTPVAKQGSITAPSGGGTVDSQARSAINSIITAVKNIGITN